MSFKPQCVAIVGLGYVGLPLAVAFGEQLPTIGFDVSTAKIDAYRRGEDPTGEVGGDVLGRASQLEFTSDPRQLARADVLIVAVPTPVDEAHQPDFSPLIGASEAIGGHLRDGAVVIYESTVYPGATEEICVPILERVSGKQWQKDFFVGYSPERINPGDKQHTLRSIIKVVAGDSPATLERVAALYELVVDAGLHRASSIRVAEAAKVIENTQRDLNIAFMNELAILFDKLGIDTLEVLEAAGTKWNFLPFRPGLVGGHCIGVDPYYLTHKAEMVGYHPQVILAGRRINDGMAQFVATRAVKEMIAAGLEMRGATANILGLTFKEDCPDVRNSQVPAIASELESYGLSVSIVDPLADPAEALHEYGRQLVAFDSLPAADLLVVAVAHAAYRDSLPQQLARLLKPGGVVVDVKGILDRQWVGAHGYKLWRL